MAARENVAEAAEKGVKKQKNPDVNDEKEAGKIVKMKLNSTEEEMIKIMVLRETNYSCFKPKAGSVFPAKRRSVKRLMFDRFVLEHFGSSASHSPPPFLISCKPVASQIPIPTNPNRIAIFSHISSPNT